MKYTMTIFFIIFLTILSINYISSQTLKIKGISGFKCEQLYGNLIFNLESNETSQELKLIPFYIYFLETQNNETILALCRLEDENKMKEIAEGVNNAEDITFSCKIEENDGQTNERTDVEISQIKDVKNNEIKVENLSGNKYVLEFKSCEENDNQDAKYMSIANRKISFRQASQFTIFTDQNKITFLISAFISQTLPKDYPIHMKVYIYQTSKLRRNEEQVESSNDEKETSNSDGDNKYDFFCFLKNTVKPTSNQTLSGNFDCSIENIKSFSEKISLIGMESYDINGLSIDSLYYDPIETDQLIKEGLINGASNEDTLPTIFTPSSIDAQECNSKGYFIINGQFDKDIEEAGNFATNLLNKNYISCNYDKIEKEKQTEIKCYLDYELEGRIILDSTLVLGENNEKFLIKPIYSENSDYNCPVGNIDEIRFLINRSFRQVSKFKITNNNALNFSLFVMESDPLKANEKITLKVNIYKNDEIKQVEAICYSTKEVNPQGNKLPAEFNCTTGELTEEYTDLEIVSSEQLAGFPTNSSLLKPAIVDKLIEDKKIKDFSLESNKNQKIPDFTIEYLDITNSSKSGIFYIIGYPSEEINIEKEIDFEMYLVTGEKASCTLPKMSNLDSESKIECTLDNKLTDKKIMIYNYTIFDGYYDGYNEIIRINKYQTTDYIKSINGTKIEDNYITELLFGQVNTLKKETDSISFIFIGFASQKISKKPITIKVNVSDGTELIEKEAICTATESPEIPEGQDVKVKYNCKVENIDKNINSSSLILISSENITGFPTEKDLLNPVIADKLILEGKVDNYTSKVFKENEIPIFNPKLLNATNSEITGIFYIGGEFLSEFKSNKTIEFDIEFLNGERAFCKLPKVNGTGIIQIECEMQEDFNDIIIIQKRSALVEYREIFRINGFRTEKEVIIRNFKEAKLEKIFNISISFKQVSGFERKNKQINYNFIGLTSKEIKKNEKIKMIVNLIRKDLFNVTEEEKEVECTAVEDIKPNLSEQLKVKFDCKLENIEEIDKCNGLEIISSEYINDIPTTMHLINPAIMDKLIKKGTIKDYSSEEIKIPIFNSTSIDTTDSDKAGKFILKGKFLSEFKPKKRIIFLITLLSGEKALCTLPKIKEENEIKIVCEMQEEFKGKIMIGQFEVLEDETEIFVMNKISSKEKVSIANGREIRTEKIYNINLSFGEVKNYETKDNTILFKFIGFTPEELKKDKKITMIVNTIKEDKLIEEEEVVCAAVKDINPKNGKKVQAIFDCKIENIEKANEFTGLKIVSSDDINSLPEEENLLNPAKVDELIKKGLARDLIIQEEIGNEISVPVFNSTSIDTADSKEKGVFTIKGKFLSKFKTNDEFKFELILVSGEKAECILPETFGNETEINITCELQEELNNTKIMIDEKSAMNGYTEVFKFNKIHTNKKVFVANGREKRILRNFNSNLSFRNTHTFNFDKSKNLVSFIISAFTSESIKKDDEINLKTNLLYKIGEKKKIAKCKPVKDEEKPKSTMFASLILNCEINNIHLDKNNDIFGVEILDSEDMTNIPVDKTLCNPKKVDQSIKSTLRNIQQGFPDFPPEGQVNNLDLFDLTPNGEFGLEGSFPDDANDTFNSFIAQALIIVRYLSEEGNPGKIIIKTDEKLKNNRILIPQSIIYKDQKEYLAINKISSNKKVSSINGKLEEALNKMKEKKICFRQISHFEQSGEKISFILSAFFRENMKKGKETNVIINLNPEKNGLKGLIAKCILNEDISGANETNPVASDFICSLNNSDIKNIEGLELIYSEEISGIPKKNIYINPIEVDKLIKLNKTVDYTLVENKKKEPYIFTFKSKDGSLCKSNSILYIEGMFNKDTDKFTFDFPLTNPNSELRCDVPPSKKGNLVKFECKAGSDFTTSSLVFEHSSYTFKNNDTFEEITILPNNSDSDRPIVCKKYITFEKEEIEKKFNSPYVYMQAQEFNKNNNEISFEIFNLYENSEENPKDKIIIKGRPLKKNSTGNIEELNPVEVECTKVNQKDNIFKFKCQFNSNEDIVGFNILESEDISGIPYNTSLSDPSSTDNLITLKNLKNCNSEDCSLPTFNSESITYSNCNNEGVFYINGKIDGKINNGSVFNLSIYPNSYANCKISINSSRIECFNKKEFEDSKIIITENVVRDIENNTNLFRLSKIISDTDDISCSINETLHKKEENYKDNNNIPTDIQTETKSDIIEPNSNSTEIFNNFFKSNQSSRGLSAGAIIGIILACIAAIVGIAIFALICNKGINGKKVDKPNSYESSHHIMNSTNSFKNST